MVQKFKVQRERLFEPPDVSNFKKNALLPNNELLNLEQS
jgi:hypothetical protein